MALESLKSIKHCVKFVLAVTERRRKERKASDLIPLDGVIIQALVGVAKRGEEVALLLFVGCGGYVSLFSMYVETCAPSHWRTIILVKISPKEQWEPPNSCTANRMTDSE